MLNIASMKKYTLLTAVFSLFLSNTNLYAETTYLPVIVDKQTLDIQGDLFNFPIGGNRYFCSEAYSATGICTKGGMDTNEGGFVYVGSTVVDMDSNQGIVQSGGAVYTGPDSMSKEGSHGLTDFWVAKITSEHAIQWERFFGGSSYDEAYSIQQTEDLGYIIAGSSMSKDGDVEGNYGDSDAWIVKLNVKGDLKWQKHYGGSGSDEAKSIEQTSDGGFVFAGYTTSTTLIDKKNGNLTGNHGSADGWVVKLDKEGNIEWQKFIGGSGWDELKFINQTTDGYVVYGRTESTDISGHYGNSDGWVVKLDKEGNIIWQKCIGGAGWDGIEVIKSPSDNKYIFVLDSWPDAVTTNTDVDPAEGRQRIEYSLGEVKISSSPSSLAAKTLSIEPPEDLTSATVTITTVSGEQKYSNKLNSGANSVDLSTYTTGIYLIIIKDKNNSVLGISKIIVS